MRQHRAANEHSPHYVFLYPYFSKLKLLHFFTIAGNYILNTIFSSPAAMSLLNRIAFNFCPFDKLTASLASYLFIVQNYFNLVKSADHNW